MEKTLFEKFGESYNNVNGYAIPNLVLPTEVEKPIGIFGKRHLRYLKEYKPIAYTNLLTSGKLNGYLADIDRQATDRMERIIEQMKKAEGITEQLKSENPMLWVQKMNNIKACAMEIIDRETIHA